MDKKKLAQSFDFGHFFMITLLIVVFGVQWFLQITQDVVVFVLMQVYWICFIQIYSNG